MKPWTWRMPPTTAWQARFGARLNRGHRLAQRLDTGIVWVNTWLNRDLRTPFGGVKQSGVGREGGAWSVNFFSTRNICVQQPENTCSNAPVEMF